MIQVQGWFPPYGVYRLGMPIAKDTATWIRPPLSNCTA
jgi:hypothetical protein